MNTNTKTTAPTPTGYPKNGGPQAFSEAAERGTAQAKVACEQMGAATTEAADAIKRSCATAVKGAQEYNNKFMEFAHANTNAAFDFVHKLWDVKSPSAFVELSTAHAQKHFETLTGQSKELAALAQKTTHAAAEPIKAGVEKAFSRAG